MTTQPTPDTLAALVTRCVTVATLPYGVPEDQCEANVMRLAATLVAPEAPFAARRLREAAERYFAKHAGEELSAEVMIERGWITSEIVLRELVAQELQTPR